MRTDMYAFIFRRHVHNKYLRPHALCVSEYHQHLILITGHGHGHSQRHVTVTFTVTFTVTVTVRVSVSVSVRVTVSASWFKKFNNELEEALNRTHIYDNNI